MKRTGRIEKKVDGDDILLTEGDGQILGMYPVLNASRDTVTVSLDGDLRRSVSTLFEDEIASFLSANVNVVLDMKNLTYISYGAMMSMLDLQHMAENNGRDLTLTAMQPDVAEKFASTGFDQLLMIR